MILEFNMETTRINDIIDRQAKNKVPDKAFIEYHLREWLNSPTRRDMITGNRYYNGDHDILKRKRKAIGECGRLEEVHNLPNNKIIDNQYSKLVDQKVNYILGKEVIFDCDKDIGEQIKEVLGKPFHRTLKNICRDSLNCGIGWLYVYYDEQGKFNFKRFAPYEILPFWADDDHTELEFALRLYAVSEFNGSTEKEVYKAELYHKNGIFYFDYCNGKLKEDIGRAYFEKGQQAYNWDKIPLIAFKYNSNELPLIKRVKPIQDNINLILSDFKNDMEENAGGSSIFILKNYGGENLGEFRRNLLTYRMVRIDSIDEKMPGELETLTTEVNAENYNSILNLLKKAMIENCKGYDINELKANGSPNEMTIKAVFSDIDLDANEIETEYQASLEQFMWFVKVHLNNNKLDTRIIFDRDLMINESQIISDIKNSAGILSNQTLISMHPYIKDVNNEIERLQQEEEEIYPELGRANNEQ